MEDQDSEEGNGGECTGGGEFEWRGRIERQKEKDGGRNLHKACTGLEHLRAVEC